MSNYLKTAAMSLLSKTLQTFLSKYLSDVDVEGVALPSVYDGSGWGVRLSNVKLREGVQLMKQMPGTVTRRRKRKRRRLRRRGGGQQPQGGGSSTTTTATPRLNDDDPATWDDERRQRKDGRRWGAVDRALSETDTHDEDGDDLQHRLGGVGTSQTRQGSSATADDGRGNNHKEAPPVAEGWAGSMPTVSEGDMSGFYSDDEHDGDGPARPSTPVQGGKGFLSCVCNSNSNATRSISTTSSRSRLNDNSLHSVANVVVAPNASNASIDTATEQAESLAFVPPGGDGSTYSREDSARATGKPRLQRDPLTTKGEGDSAGMKDFRNDSTSAAGHDPIFGASRGPSLLPQPHTHDDGRRGMENGQQQGGMGSNILDDDYEEEEYEEEYELPLRLCLGEGGRIGTLDVRLNGKELHVMVEDAMITIEAIPFFEPDMDPSDDAGGTYPDGKGGGAGGGQQQDSATTASDADGSAGATAAAKAKRKVEPKRDTVGDRVLADNPLARLISSIPHLFLRDIRIRLIVRDRAVPAPRENGDKGAPTAGSEWNDKDGGTRPQPSPKDTMVEVGIDFLSVTSGEDVLSHFSDQVDEVSHSSHDGINTSERSSSAAGQLNPPSLLNIPSMTNETNEYLVRHIRTGRGPSAGIFVQLLAADMSFPATGLSKNHVSNPDSSLWARQQWIEATEYYFLRCSGVDIRARIHLGTKKVDAGYSWFYGEFVDEEGIDYDSMILLGGMDTVAPGPRPPLPPMEPRMSRGSTMTRESVIDSSPHFIGVTENGRLDSGTGAAFEDMLPLTSSIHPGADVYETDQNGIQSCRVPSLFHRVSRGMEPTSCKECKHLPSGVCDLCWAPSKGDVKESSELDLSLPMPGLALQIGFRDPLEVNVDRFTLEAIDLLKSLFMKSSLPAVVDKSEQEPSRDEAKESAPILAAATERDEATVTTTASTGFFSSILFGRSKEIMKEEEPSESFSAIMEAEKIEVMGLYASQIILRIHVMKEDKRDRGLSFCYWSLGIDCLTIDRQTLNAPEKKFQDVKLDIGRLAWVEFRGTGSTSMVTLGLPQPPRRRCDSQSSITSMVEDHEHNRTPWPSTACALLDIPPPLESLVYKSRERHGVQLRFVSLSPCDTPLDTSKSLVHLRLGVTEVHSPLAVSSDINVIMKEIMDHVVGTSTADGRAKPEDQRNNEDPRDNEKRMNRTDRETRYSKDIAKESAVVARPKSLMKYAIQIDSGNITVSPLIVINLPLTKFSGALSSEAGIFFETVLEKIELAYGTMERKISKGCLTLPQIAGLPESARMHILLCLKDLSALEKALFVKKEKNSFRRIKAVDKAILKIAKRISKRDSKVTKRLPSLTSSVLHDSASSLRSGDLRQQILSDIMKLDDKELTELWTVHQRYQRKVAKRRHEA